MNVKLHFESDLNYQLAAIDAVCDLFKGQECTSQSPFTVSVGTTREEGLANSLELREDQILENLHQIQERNGVPQTECFGKSRKSDGVMSADYDFTVEMETGTGKTYVYLRTIFELHKRYGFKKFVIVVPSIAIKEGVFKSIELTQSHFRSLYSGVPIHPFMYDSSRLGDVWSYATSSKIEIMVCTIQAITAIQDSAEASFSDTPKKRGKKTQRVIHSPNEKTGGMSPITFIQNCHPIVIIDEPQKIGNKGEQQGIRELNPLCTLRYSATHKDLFAPLYCLNAVDAAEQKLVKTVEVAEVKMDVQSSSPTYKLLKTYEKNGYPYADIELMCRKNDGDYTEKKFAVTQGDNLGLITGLPEVYREATVQAIDNNSVTISTLDKPLHKGDSIAGEWEESLMRGMIRATIREHLEKQIKLLPYNIKVLSLFFISHVADYSTDGVKRDGRCAQIFEEEYASIRQMARYKSIFEKKDYEPSEVHNGYFSITKRKKGETTDRWEDTPEKEKKNDEAAARAFELIMRDKERLLSLDEPLSFIFSHSALREGWDNPNVFQVCVLRDIASSMSRRQTIGRGLRICVNQQGKRVRDESINRLTVIGKENFRSFASGLQKEYESDGLKFGVVTKERVAAISYETKDETGKTVTLNLGLERSQEVIEHCQKVGYLDKNGKVTSKLKVDLDEGRVSLPESCHDVQMPLLQYLKKTTMTVPVKDAKEQRIVAPRRRILEDDQFRELWRRISKKTTYRINFDSSELIEKVISPLEKELSRLQDPNIIVDTVVIKTNEGGISAGQKKTKTMGKVEGSRLVPDVLTELQERTGLTRRTISAILKRLGKIYLERIRTNPREFLNICQSVIRKALNEQITEGVSYKPVTIGEKYWAQELFDREISTYADSVMETGENGKCLTDYVVCDSDIEKSFAQEAEECENIKYFAKLPEWFKIQTPLGAYNPDWAVIYEKDDETRLYLVVETKGKDLLADLDSAKQDGKIKCGKRHFDCLKEAPDIPEPHAEYVGPVSSVSRLVSKIA